MAASYPDISLTGTWRDIVALGGYSTVANQRVTIQAKGSTDALVYFGGAAAPSNENGIALKNEASVSGTSEHVWIKGFGTFAVLAED